MTSRLKKKLDQLEEDGNNLNESFCLIGTPLPSLADSKRDKNEFVPVWKQEVRDEQGRRRFHGAFTGGFSAGYYNTVGSKEGWTPSTFVSSRNQRASKTQNVEDFMDEEDLEELRNSRKLENTDTFKADGFGTAAELGARGEDGSFSSALTSLIQPSTSSIGQKLLMKMGWKPGQGIGPRLTARQLKLQERKIGRRAAHVGSYVPEMEDDEDPKDAVDAQGKKHTFAPRDTGLMSFDNKQDRAGLGYVRGAGLNMPVASGSKSNQTEDISTGFGLGGHDADEDDLDIYANGAEQLRSLGDGGNGRRTAYDEQEDGDMQEGVVLLGEGVVGRDRARSRAQAQDTRDRTRLEKPAGKGGDVWHDGRPVVPGFTVDLKVVSNDQWFKFPEMPEGWRPRPARVWKTGMKRWDQAEVSRPEEVLDTRKNRSQMSADQRGEVLGEEQLKGPVKSVFDYMSAKSRERLAQIIPADRQPGASVGVSVEEEKPRIDEPQEGVIVPPLSPRTASAALKGFIPFGDDPGKQLRYTSYLRSQVVNTTEPNPKLFPSGKLDQVNKELSDFMKSAQMFRPMSFAMANRFTSSKLSTQDMAQPKPGLHVPDPTKVDEWKDKAKLEQEVKEVLTPREEAARAGLWGKMTRVTADWAPNALVCKRFGVANPWPDGLPGTASETKQPEGSAPSVGRALGTKPLLSAPGDDVAWQNNFVHQAKPEESKPELEDGDAIPKDRKPRTIAEVGMAEDENQGRDTLTYKKPELDIFKAIFASDDEDDSEDEDEEPVRATPLHLDLQNPTPMTVEPSNEAKPTAEGTTLPPVVNIPVAEDVARPIFGLANSKNKTEGDSKRASKKDKKRDRVKAKTMLSFDVGEDGDEDLVVEDKRDKKRRKKVEPDTKVEAVPIKIDEDDEWVEAPPVL